MGLFWNICCNIKFWCFVNTGQWKQTVFQFPFWFSIISSFSFLSFCKTCKIRMVIYVEINPTLSLVIRLPAWFLLSAGHVLWGYDFLCADIQMCLSKWLVSKQTWWSDCPIRRSCLKIVLSSLSRHKIFMTGGGAVDMYHLLFIATLIPNKWETWRQFISCPVSCLLHLCRKVPGCSLNAAKEMGGLQSLKGLSFQEHILEGSKLLKAGGRLDGWRVKLKWFFRVRALVKWFFWGTWKWIKP